MAKTQFKWRLAGFREVRTLPGVREELVRRAERIAAASGGADAGYVVRSTAGRNRARAAVITATIRAMASNRKHNTLVRNIDAGRG